MDFLLKHLFFRQDCSQYTWTFRKACAHNRPTLLCSLAHREDIKNYKTDEMYKLLLNACKNNYVEVVKFLISRDVKMHTYLDSSVPCMFMDSSLKLRPHETTSVFTQCAEIGNINIMRLFENIEFVENISETYGDRRIIYLDAIKLGCFLKNIEVVQYIVEQYNIKLDTSKSIFWHFVLATIWKMNKNQSNKNESEVFNYLINHCDTSNGILSYAERLLEKFMMTNEQIDTIDKLLQTQKN